MINPYRGGEGSLGRDWGNTGGRYNSLAGANTDRQTRFEARSARRWGDWGILEVPTAILWMDSLCVPLLGDPDECGGEVIVGLWP